MPLFEAPAARLRAPPFLTLPDVAAPPLIEVAPPFSTDDVPAAAVKLPPFPLLPVPTDKEMEPPVPPVAVPV